MRIRTELIYMKWEILLIGSQRSNLFAQDLYEFALSLASFECQWPKIINRIRPQILRGNCYSKFRRFLSLCNLESC